MATSNILGLEAVLKQLDELPKRLSKNIMRGALRAGANVIANEARALVPVDKGQLKASIRVSDGFRQGTGVPYATISAGSRYDVYKGKGRKTSLSYKTVDASGKITYHAAYYASFVEYGTAFMGSRPFMRPAFDSTVLNDGAAIRAVADYVQRRFEAAMKANGG